MKNKNAKKVFIAGYLNKNCFHYDNIEYAKKIANTVFLKG